MLKNYFLVTWRSLMKKKLFVFINILGMGLAVALCIVAYLNWSFRDEWDGGQENRQTLFRIQFWHDFHGQRDRYGISPMPLANHIKQNIKDVKAVTRFLPDYSNVRIGDELFSTAIAYGDSAFFDMFTVDLRYGNLADFKDRSKIFISDELARKYFNREDVVGRQITQMNNGSPKEFTIGGVFRKWPLNASFRFDAITLWDNLWDKRVDVFLKDADWAQMTTTFVQLEDPGKAEAVSRQLQQYVEPQNTARPDLKVQNFYLENFEGLSNRSIQRPWIKGNDLRLGQPDAVVTIPSVMAALLLLLACFNFTNTSIALSSKRLKEIGIRKVMGGMRKQLIIQFMGENLFLCFLGFMAGLLIAEFLVPAYDSLWPWLELHFRYTQHIGMLLFLLGLLAFTALLAGGYPAFYVTSFEPVNILKGASKLRGTTWLTRTLLAAQFSISLITIIFAVGFYHNARYQESYDLGFSTTGVISVYIGGEGAFNTYRNALAENEDILKIAGTKNHVANSFYPGAVRYAAIEKQIDVMDVGDDYLEAVNIRVLSGRGFTRDSETDRKESVLVTEEFVRQFGWKDDAVGKRIVWRDTVQLYVIGVTKDIYARTLWQPLQPMMIRYIPPANYQQMVVQVAMGKMAGVNAFMKEKWKEIFPNQLYESQFIDQTLRRTNDTNSSVIIIFGFLGFFAALMSATGLYTLVSLTIAKRIREIGIRKVLGASVINLVGVISFEFIVILMMASLLGGMVGYAMVDVSMDAAWEYYKKVNLLTLGTSIGIILLLAVLTVGFKTIHAARMNPVKNLRTE